MINDYPLSENQINQLRYVPRLTQDGFTKRKTPDDVFSQILKYYQDNKDNFTLEDSSLSTNGISNIDDIESPAAYLAYNYDFTMLILESLKIIHEEWCKFELIASMGYGPRKYVKGSYLRPHADKPQTHVISSIINIDQDDKHDWPLQIYGYDNEVNEVYLKPGEMFLYEGSKLLHGRTQPYQGTHFVNLFLHYRPSEYYIPKVDVEGAYSYKDLNTETDWIDFSNKNTSERIVGITF